MIACIGASHLSDAEKGVRGVRCRRYVESFGETCHDHKEFTPEQTAPILQPDKILLKINVNPRWENEFVRAGVFVTVKTRQRETQIRQEHVAEAEEFGRKGFPYRTDVPDSGTAVFGKDGTGDVEVVGLFKELTGAGYHLTNLHIEKRELKHLPVLIATFEKAKVDENRVPLAAIAVLVDFLMGSWEHMHVYANPYKPDGTIMHTVNCVHRQPELEAKNSISFANGLWNLIPH